MCVVVGLGTGHAMFNFKPSLPRTNDGKNATYNDDNKGFAGRTSHKHEEDEIVDPCCQYLAMEEDSEHNDNNNGSNKSNTNGNITNPLR